MKLFAHVSEAVSDIQETASRVGNSAQWNTTAMVAITAVSVVALLVATMALARVNR